MGTMATPETQKVVAKLSNPGAETDVFSIKMISALEVLSSCRPPFESPELPLSHKPFLSSCLRISIPSKTSFSHPPLHHCDHDSPVSVDDSQLLGPLLGLPP